MAADSGFHGGEVTEDTAIMGDITLTSDVVIHEGVVLTILPGSRVRLGKDVAIHVYGGLIAEGDAPDSIVFERLDPGSAWGNISLWESAKDEDCRLVYCIVTGGGGRYLMGPAQGRGAIYCYKSSPTISSNTISGNAAIWGAGIYCEESSPTIAGNTICANTCAGGLGLPAYGGGIYCRLSSPTIVNNVISQNSVEVGDGGGISCWGSSPIIVNNTIIGNSAWSGGGIHCTVNSSPTITNNTIADNLAGMMGGDGGGICCLVSSPTISNNAISGNLAYRNGGGIHCSASPATITNNMITGNSLCGEDWSAGGGISCLESSVTMANNTIAGNSGLFGGGIWSQVTSLDLTWPTVCDCIIWGNGDDACGQWSVTYSCVGDLDAEGEGNIHDDPIFNASPSGDHYLDPQSPCIDAGSQSAKDAGLSDRTTQADGTPDTGAVDMGYHHPVPSR